MPPAKCSKHNDKLQGGLHISRDLIGSECQEIIEAWWEDGPDDPWPYLAVWVSPHFAREHGIQPGSHTVDADWEPPVWAKLIVPRCAECFREDHPDFEFPVETAK